MIMLLLDTGARRAELVDLTLAHVDLDLDVLLVLGKGRRERALPFGHKAGPPWTATVAPGRAIRTPRCPGCGLAAGPADQMGLGADAARRGEQAGLPGLHLHQLRHTFAHQLAEGGGETDLMRLAELEVPCDAATLRRLGRGRPAREAHRRLSPGDRL